MKRNYNSGPPLKVEGIVPLEKGGTGADNLPQARINLNLVSSSTVGRANGPIPLDQNGKFNNSYLAGLSFDSIDVDGPKVLQINETAVYQITNFDSRLRYTVSAQEGQVFLTGETITYTAPPTQVNGGGFSVNSSFFNIEIEGPDRTPNQPSIVEPSSDVVLNQDFLEFESSAWSSNHSTDYLSNVFWEVSDNENFTSKPGHWVTQSQNYRFILSGLNPGEKAYVRMRHQGYFGFFSPWSDIRIFERSPVEKPLKPTIISPNADSVGHEVNKTFESSLFNATGITDNIAEAEWEVSTSADFSQGVQRTLKTSDFYNHTFSASNYMTYYVRVRYKGTLGWYSDWSDIRSYTYYPIEPPERPTIVNPAINTVVTSDRPVLTSSEFTAVSPGDNILEAEWQISLDGGFEFNVVTEITTGANYNSFRSPSMVPGEPYFYRVRYKGTSGWLSQWSIVRTITLAQIMRPSIVSPNDDSERLESTVVFTCTPFEIRGMSASHSSSDWQVSETPTFDALVVYSTGANLLSWTAVGLPYGKTYYARVRHRSDTLLSSDWSNVISFKTKNAAWDPLLIAEIAVLDPKASVSVSPFGEIFAIENKLYKLDPIGPSLVREFSDEEVFGNAVSFLTPQARVSKVVSVSSTGNIVEVFATANMPDAIGAVPRSMLSYGKYSYSNNSLLRVEHFVTGNPLVSLTLDNQTATVQSHDFQFIGILNADENANRTLIIKQLSSNITYYGKVERSFETEIIPVPSQDTYSIVEFPELVNQSLILRLDSVYPNYLFRNYTPTGYFDTELNQSEINFHKNDSLLWRMVLRNNNHPVTPQGQALTQDEKTLFTVQSNRLFIYKN